MLGTEITMEILTGGQSVRLPISGTSARTVALAAGAGQAAGQLQTCTFTADVDCFVRKGTNPTAIVDLDQFIMARNTYRCQMLPGECLAFVTPSATGNVYFSPGA